MDVARDVDAAVGVGLVARDAARIKTGIIPGDYQKQIAHALWVSGARWCDWLSYQPDFQPGLQTEAGARRAGRP